MNEHKEKTNNVDACSTQLQLERMLGGYRLTFGARSPITDINIMEHLNQKKPEDILNQLGSIKPKVDSTGSVSVNQLESQKLSLISQLCKEKPECITFDQLRFAQDQLEVDLMDQLSQVTPFNIIKIDEINQLGTFSQSDIFNQQGRIKSIINNRKNRVEQNQVTLKEDLDSIEMNLSGFRNMNLLLSGDLLWQQQLLGELQINYSELEALYQLVELGSRRLNKELPDYQGYNFALCLERSKQNSKTVSYLRLMEPLLDQTRTNLMNQLQQLHRLKVRLYENRFTELTHSHLDELKLNQLQLNQAIIKMESHRVEEDIIKLFAHSSSITNEEGLLLSGLEQYFSDKFHDNLGSMFMHKLLIYELAASELTNLHKLNQLKLEHLDGFIKGDVQFTQLMNGSIGQNVGKRSLAKVNLANKHGAFLYMNEDVLFSKQIIREVNDYLCHMGWKINYKGSAKPPVIVHDYGANLNSDILNIPRKSSTKSGCSWFSKKKALSVQEQLQSAAEKEKMEWLAKWNEVGIEWNQRVEELYNKGLDVAQITEALYTMVESVNQYSVPQLYQSIKGYMRIISLKTQLPAEPFYLEQLISSYRMGVNICHLLWVGSQINLDYRANTELWEYAIEQMEWSVEMLSFLRFSVGSLHDNLLEERIPSLNSLARYNLQYIRLEQIESNMRGYTGIAYANQVANLLSYSDSDSFSKKRPSLSKEDRAFIQQKIDVLSKKAVLYCHSAIIRSHYAHYTYMESDGDAIIHDHQYLKSEWYMKNVIKTIPVYEIYPAAPDKELKWVGSNLVHLYCAQGNPQNLGSYSTIEETINLALVYLLLNIPEFALDYSLKGITMLNNFYNVSLGQKSDIYDISFARIFDITGSALLAKYTNSEVIDGNASKLDLKEKLYKKRKLFSNTKEGYENLKDLSVSDVVAKFEASLSIKVRLSDYYRSGGGMRNASSISTKINLICFLDHENKVQFTSFTDNNRNIDSNVFSSYLNLGVVYFIDKQVGKSIDYLNKAAQMAEGIYGKNHPNTTQSYLQLSKVYSVIGDDISRAIALNTGVEKMSNNIASFFFEAKGHILKQRIPNYCMEINKVVESVKFVSSNDYDKKGKEHKQEMKSGGGGGDNDDGSAIINNKDIQMQLQGEALFDHSGLYPSAFESYTMTGMDRMISLRFENLCQNFPSSHFSDAELKSTNTNILSRLESSKVQQVQQFWLPERSSCAYHKDKQGSESDLVLLLPAKHITNIKAQFPEIVSSIDAMFSQKEDPSQIPCQLQNYHSYSPRFVVSMLLVDSCNFTSQEVIDQQDKASGNDDIAKMHWVGLIGSKQRVVPLGSSEGSVSSKEDMLLIQYIDSENFDMLAVLPSVGVLQADDTFSYYDPLLRLEQVHVKKQQYNNCGPELIENIVNTIVGHRIPEDSVVQFHSLLLENALLGSQEEVYNIRGNAKLLSSSTDTEVDLCGGYCIKATPSILNMSQNISATSQYSSTLPSVKSWFKDKVVLHAFAGEQFKLENLLGAEYVRNSSFYKNLSTNHISEFTAKDWKLLKCITHPDKGGNVKDFHLVMKMSQKDGNADTVFEEKMQEFRYKSAGAMQTMYKVSIVSKSANLAVDAGHLYAEFSAASFGKFAMDAVNLYSMVSNTPISRGLNVVLSGYNIINAGYNGDYWGVTEYAVSSLFYNVALPVAMSYSPLIALPVVVGMAVYDVHSTIQNAVDLYDTWDSPQYGIGVEDSFTADHLDSTSSVHLMLGWEQ